jgi:TRAP-type C4-dicarboxylate transport system permease small subunit
LSDISSAAVAPGRGLAFARPALDWLYRISGYLAAASLAMIFVLTMLQMGGRLLGHNIRGLTDYAGYFMAASAFFAFAHAFNEGVHIRIELFMSMAGRFRSWIEKIALAAATGIAAWFAYYSCSMVYWSYKLGDVSQGMDATALWIPQLSMALGTVLFAVAVADQALQFLITGEHSIKPSADAL